MALATIYGQWEECVLLPKKKERDIYRQRAPVRAITAVVVDVADGCCLWLLCARGGEMKKSYRVTTAALILSLLSNTHTKKREPVWVVPTKSFTPPY